MESNSDNKQTLVEKYNIDSNNGDKDLINLKKILDVEETSKSNVDWYLTETFQIFLDALDVGQQPTNKGGRSKSGHVSGSVKDSSEKLNNSNDSLISDSKLREPSQNVVNSLQTGRRQNDLSNETILSAEALKILSELPNLSHMSPKRSFIFPNSFNNNNNTNSSDSKSNQR